MFPTCWLYILSCVVVCIVVDSKNLWSNKNGNGAAINTIGKTNSSTTEKQYFSSILNGNYPLAQNELKQVRSNDFTSSSSTWLQYFIFIPNYIFPSNYNNEIINNPNIPFWTLNPMPVTIPVPTQVLSEPYKSNYPICIVGGGISGINLAYLLQQKGYKIEIFEKENRIGGKIETFRIQNDVQVEMGPFFFTNTTKSLLNIINRHGLTIVSYNESDRVGFDPFTGNIYPFPKLNEEEEINLKMAVKNYIIARSEYINDLEYGYINARPELFIPISEWLDNRGLGILKPILLFIITAQGYGDLEDIPTLYILKLVTVELILGVTNSAGSFFTVKEGLDILINKMAALLNTPIHLNSTVTHVFRKKNHQVIYFKNEDKIDTTNCQNVIIAFPPLLPNLKKMLIDLTPEEIEVLGNVRIHKYTSGAHQIPNLNRSVYVGTVRQVVGQNSSIVYVSPYGIGEVIGLLKQSTKNFPDIFSSYSWIRGDYDTIPNESDLVIIEQQRENILKKLNPNSKTLYRKTTEYFPHVNTNALRNGFYKKFDSIQGKKGLYYMTTLLGFETMDNALRLTETFVNKYFKLQ